MIAEGVDAAMVANGNNIQHQRYQNGCSYKTFMGNTPQEFSGVEGLAGLTRWFEKLGSIFCVNNVREEDKVKFAICTLVNSALTWWNTHIQAVGNDEAYQLTWNVFKQRTITLMTDETLKIEAYIEGFSEAIEMGFESHNPQNIEAAMVMVHKLNDKILKRGKKSQDGETSNVVAKKQGHVAQDCKVVVPNVTPAAYANNSTGVKTGTATPRVCYECGKPGYFRDTCTKKKKTVGNARGRSFNINVRDAEDDPKLLTSTFSVNNLLVYVLFDLGPDLSFMFNKLSPKIITPLSPLDRTYAVEVANGKVLKAENVYCNCNIILVDRNFEVDLVPIELGSFDVVIGMDWSFKFRAEIVCYDKAVRINQVEGESLMVYGDKKCTQLNLISCLKVQKYLRKGCHTILAHVIRSDKEERWMEDVNVVRDFPEVSSEDFPELPPHRAVEFQIDLAPGAVP
ncbi:uncharacterized protein [Rutidosis leptorrhynchoides]|uniref:uncharacterized protein n=1 Tax=Rutidosis leptorrhynchoides TaxID=125765 RepID=UPI003A996060